MKKNIQYMIIKYVFIFFIAISLNIYSFRIQTPFANEKCDCTKIGTGRYIIQKDIEKEMIWNEFASFLAEGLRVRNFSPFKKISADINKIKNLLKDPIDSNIMNPEFILCTLEGYYRLADHLIETGNYEVVNARLFSLPFYLFSNIKGKENNTDITLIYYTPDDYYEIKHYIKEIVSPIFGLSVNMDVHKNNFPERLAQHLVYKSWVAAIIDEEPSYYVQKFIQEYKRLRIIEGAKPKNQKPLLYPLDLSREDSPSSYILNMPEAGIQKIIIDYDEQDFFDFKKKDKIQRQGVIGIGRWQVQKEWSKNEFPLLLTNIRSFKRDCCIKKFWAALSDAYLGILYLAKEKDQKVLENKESRMKAGILQQSLLLNSLLVKDKDALNVILLYGFLKQMAGNKNLSKEKKENYKRKADLLLDQLNMKIEKLIDKIEVRIKKLVAEIEESIEWNDEKTMKRVIKKYGIDKEMLERLGFSRSSSYAYDITKKALDKKGLDKAETAIITKKALRHLSSLLNDVKPAEFKFDRGLYHVPNYNPYWQLTRILFIQHLGKDPEFKKKKRTN